MVVYPFQTVNLFENSATIAEIEFPKGLSYWRTLYNRS